MKSTGRDPHCPLAATIAITAYCRTVPGTREQNSPRLGMIGRLNHTEQLNFKGTGSFDFLPSLSRVHKLPNGTYISRGIKEYNDINFQNDEKHCRVAPIRK
jgi:hypothetical protein